MAKTTHRSTVTTVSHPGVQQRREEYLSQLAAVGYSSKSILIYRLALARFGSFLLERGIERLRDVAREDLEAYASALRERGFAPASLALFVRVVRQFFGYLEEHDLVFFNPASGMRIPKAPPQLLPVPSEAEMEKLLGTPDVSTPAGVRDRAFLETAYSTGARRQELAALLDNDLDLGNGTIRVLGKGNKERLLPLGQEAIRWLERYLKEARPKLLKSKPELAALWINSRGRALAYLAVERMIKKHARAAGLATAVSPHSFRRACATHMLRRGAHPVQLQMLLGHASLRTLSCYLRLTITELKQTHAASKPGQ